MTFQFIKIWFNSSDFIFFFLIRNKIKKNVRIININFQFIFFANQLRLNKIFKHLNFFNLFSYLTYFFVLSTKYQDAIFLKIRLSFPCNYSLSFTKNFTLIGSVVNWLQLNKVRKLPRFIKLTSTCHRFIK